MIPMLRIFDPTIFPTPISHSHFLTAMSAVISSGKDVPMATTVNQIILSDNHIFCAIITALSTTMLLPNIITKSHQTIIRINNR